MKVKTTLFSICFFLVTIISFSQKKNTPISIIGKGASIKKYHDSNTLEQLQKGQLLNLYTERIQALSIILPNIAFTTKPGVTITDIGIPETNNNKKAFENQIENTNNYIKETIEFQKAILPYSDTEKLAKAILFYEEIMKSIHSYNEFN